MSTTPTATGNYTWKIFSEVQTVFFSARKKSGSPEALTAVPCHGENTPKKKKKEMTINLDSTLLSND